MMPVKSNYPDVWIPENVDLWQFVQIKTARFMDRKALIDSQTGETLTYSELLNAVKNVRNALWHSGMRKGDVMMVFAPNHIATPLMMLAATSLGAIYNGCNFQYTAEELLEQLKDCQASFIVTCTALLPKVKTVLRKTQWTFKKLILLDGQQNDWKNWHDLLNMEVASAPWVPINPKQDVVWLVYSSGTTGKPKGVLLTHYNLISSLLQLANPDLALDPDDREGVISLFVPMYFIGGICAAVHCLCNVGKTLLVMDKFDFKNALEYTQKYKIRNFGCVPPVAVLMVKSPLVDQYDLSSMTSMTLGGAPLSKEMDQLIKQKFGIKLIKQLYGLSETTGFTTIVPNNTESPAGTVGKLLPNIEVKVIDLGTGLELGANMDGELHVRGPNIMTGYLNNAKATAETMDKDGWLKTGDIGYYDRDGFFFITDRLKELIKYKAIQVAPASVEAELLTHESVADAAVIGVPDPYAGELPKAAIVLKPGHTATEQDIQKYIEGRLAPHKWLRGGVQFMDSIPKNPSGKILRRVLKEKMLPKQERISKL